MDAAEIAAIAAIVGEENVLTADAAAPYSIGGVTPPAVTAPGTREEAARLILLAAERGWALVPYGGGTQMETGFPPRKLDLVLSTRRLDRIVDYQPDDMTITVEPGVTLRTVEETLAGRSQFLPLDPPLPDRATVGGTMAAAVAGPWRAGFGTPRDWVIGCRVVGADGREVRGGGQVVKNVAGYDLPKLYTGSFGTLGLITEVTFKVMPHPGASGYCRVGLRKPEEVEALLGSVMHSDLQPAAAVLVCEEDAPEGRTWALYFQFLHAREAVDWQLRHLAEMAETLGGEAETLPPEAGEARLREFRDRPAQELFVARVGTVSARVAEVAAGAVEVCREAGIAPGVLAHAATGQVYVCAGADAGAGLAEELRSLAGSAGATCVFLRLPKPLAGEVDPWGEAGPQLRLMRGIKQTLDPEGVFSPGRFVGGI